MKKWRYVLLGALICLLIFLALGCRTSYWEWNDAMTNQSGSHVEPFNPDDQAQRSDAVRPSTRVLTPSGPGLRPGRSLPPAY
jgi:hypothetical protein